MKLINILLFLKFHCKTKELITVNICDTRLHAILAIGLIETIIESTNKSVISVVNKFVFDSICKKIERGVIK